MGSRRWIATVIVVLTMVLAGCNGHAAGRLTMTPVDDAALADRASSELDATDPFETMEAGIIREAIEAGSTTRNASRSFVHADRPFQYDGAYYNVSYEVIGQVPGYAGGVRIDYNTSAAAGTAIAFADLPAVDQRRLAPLFEDQYRDDGEGFDIGIPVSYTEAEADESVLVPDQEYDVVVYEGESYRIGTDDVRQRSLDTYRYEATKLADSDRELATLITDRYAFTLSGLSSDERDVVDSALDDTYRAESSDDEAFAGVVDQFRAHEAVRADSYSGEWIVVYDGQRYWGDLDYGGFVTDTGPSVTRPSVTPPPE